MIAGYAPKLELNIEQWRSWGEGPHVALQRPANSPTQRLLLRVDRKGRLGCQNGAHDPERTSGKSFTS